MMLHHLICNMIIPMHKLILLPPVLHLAEFQDIQVMIFIGFGFLMTFLRKYGYSATGYTLFMAALVVQWSVLMKGFLHMEDGKIR